MTTRIQYDTNFNRWRLECGFTQQQAAKALDISKSHVENYDKGINRTSKEKAIPPYAIRVLMTIIAQKLVVSAWPE
jgi:DNA-binding XRE family transcriptional regulator